MKPLALLIVLILCVPVFSYAEIFVSGTVIDKENNEPLVGASVMIKGGDGKIKKFATSKQGGKFNIALSSIEGCSLEISMISFAKQTIPLHNAKFPLTVYLEPGSIQLKEVAVKADKIREQGDTITYGVSAFAQTQDRSIGDVLKRMPGIDVEKSGKIKYQGEDINKFYIEGADLLGGKYGVATNGINHEDVGAVEVMENHQPMQVLSGISFSDKAAINLKLKNKAKATWSFNGKAAGGYSWQPQGALWEGELFAMAVMPKFQNITTLRANNTGRDLSSQITDFFALSRETDLSRYTGISLPGVPSLNRKRTLMNRSAMISTNSLWKLRNGEFKTQIDYSFNRITADATNITTYFLPDGNRMITEKRSGLEKTHSLSARFIYELNRKTAFINNTLKTNIDWDKINVDLTGSIPNNQSANLPDYYVNNDLKIIKRFNGKHLITFRSQNEWESLPQTLNVNINGSLSHQNVRDHAFFTDESIAYAFTLKGITVSMEAGLKGYLRSMKSDLEGTVLDSFETVGVLGDLTNTVNTNYFTIYAIPKFEYWIQRVNIALNVPIRFAQYTFNKSIADRSEFYISPSLKVNWKPNNRLSVTLGGRTGRSPMNLNLIHPGYVMTDYRSFSKGVDDFYNSSSHSISAQMAYKHTRKGIFGDIKLMQSWSAVPFTMSQQLIGDYIVHSYSSARNRSKSFIANGKIGKALNFMRGSSSINGSFRKTESHLISQQQSVNSVGTSWNAGIKINCAPVRWLSIDYKFDFSSSRLAMNGEKASWLSSIENELLFDILPLPKWEWTISGEHYRNEIAPGSYKNLFLLDTKITFNLNKKIELSASLNNIFDRRTYNYITYNQLSSYESRRWLRGRELLLSLTLRK